MPRKTVSRATTTKTSSPSPLSKIGVNQILYTLLLVSFLAIGYLAAMVQYKAGGFGGGGSAIQTGTGGGAGTGTQPGAKVEVENGKLPPIGDDDAKVTIVEFSDLQCPFCRRFFVDTYAQLKKEYVDTGKVVMYFRHYPLSFHPMAVPTAQASECANDQDKFWEFHDKAYQEQEKQGQGTITYTNDDIKRWAAELGLDTAEFNECFDSQKHKAKVDEDFAAGQAAGVDGTPSFFINGTKLVGAQPFTAFKAIIDQELNN
jgi:protein-disulfide isomerase